MSTIWLVRHGQAAWAAEDYDQLSDVGAEQMRLLGRAWADRGLRPDRVVSGGMRRHRQSVEATGLAQVPVVDQGFDEFDHLAVLWGFGGEARALAELPDGYFDEALRRWRSGEFDTDYDEPFPAFVSRVRDALVRTAEATRAGETVAVFTSGGPISVIAALLVAGEPMQPEIHGRLAPVLVNSSVTTVVDGAERGLRLVTFNEHTHLGADTLTYR